MVEKQRRIKQKAARIQQRNWLFKIAAMDPRAWNTTGKCNFCNMYTENHKPDCVWVEIRDYAKTYMKSSA